MPIKYITCKDCERQVNYSSAVGAPDGKGDLCLDCYNSRQLTEKNQIEAEKKAPRGGNISENPTTLQKYLDNEYPNKKDKKELKQIVLSNFVEELCQKKIEGGKLNLDEYERLEVFVNDLEKQVLKTPLNKLEVGGCSELFLLNCSNSQINSLDLSKNAKLTHLIVHNNQLSSIDFLKILFNPEKLESLSISENNVQPTNVELFGRFVNLKKLEIGNDNQEKIQQGIYNRFIGSLKPLQNLAKLEELYINNTDIDSGLEYLPESIEEFACSANYKKDAKVKVIEEELSKFGEAKDNNFASLLKTWKQARLDQITARNKKDELTQLITLSQKKLNESEQVWLEILLEMQEELTKSARQDKTAQKQFTKAKEKLNNKLRKGEIENLCELQEEITQLENQLTNLQIQDKQEQQAQILQPPYGIPGSSK